MIPWRPFAVALALPVLFTGLVLFDVQRNRAGGRAPIDLTEREVTLSAGTDENSGMTAWIVWADAGAGARWLPAATVRSLGFDLSNQLRGSRSLRQLPRRAYVVLELRNGQPTRSRLVPVDAGLDREALIARYPNGRTHLIAPGFIGVREAGPGAAGSLEGYLVNIDPRGIHVPTALAARLRRAYSRNPRFTISIRYGSRLEPWVVDASR
jgi:hypothetical protein